MSSSQFEVHEEQVTLEEKDQQLMASEFPQLSDFDVAKPIDGLPTLEEFCATAKDSVNTIYNFLEEGSSILELLGQLPQDPAPHSSQQTVNDDQSSHQDCQGLFTLEAYFPFLEFQCF